MKDQYKALEKSIFAKFLNLYQHMFFRNDFDVDYLIVI